MGYGAVVFVQMAQMFVLMGVGFWLFRSHRLSEGGSKDMGSVLLFVVIPVMIVRSLWIERTAETTGVIAATFLLALVLHLLSLAVSCALFRRDGLLAFSSAFSNAGFAGIPLVQAALGSEALLYIVCTIGWLNVLQGTVGVWLITHDRSLVSPRAVTENPIVLAFALGLALFFLAPAPPSFVSDVMGTIADLNVPLAMLVSGGYLAQVRRDDLAVVREVLGVCASRLVLVPLLSLLLLALVPGVSGEVRLALLIASSAPTGTNAAIYAHQYGGSYRTAVLAICLTTLCSIATLPALISLGAMVLA